MLKLLSRDAFRESVFKRDNNKCVICGNTANDAHHIMERRLFTDGGYYIDNGASLCNECHIKAEQTIISPDALRNKIGIKKIILPEHLYPDYEYDKWSNIMHSNGTRIKGELFHDESVQKALKSGNVLDKFLPYIKYPRTFHMMNSPGKTEDDKTLKSHDQFYLEEVVVTVKMDGENTTGYSDGYTHARSLDSNNHPSRNWVKNYLSDKLFQLPKGWRICGENLYAKHSIEYKNLECYFHLFSIWDENNICLDWDSTIEWSNLLELKLVPTLYRGIYDEEKILNEYINRKSWDNNEIEGFVVRLTSEFSYGEFATSVAKFVRENHVQTNKHWIKTKTVKNGL